MKTTDPKTAPLGIDAEDERPATAPLILTGKTGSDEGLNAQRAAALDALKPNCGSCRCSHFPFDDPETWGECRNEPPRMQIIATPPKIAGQGPVYQPLSAWPPVQRTQWCVNGFQLKARIAQ